MSWSRVGSTLQEAQHCGALLSAHSRTDVSHSKPWTDIASNSSLPLTSCVTFHRKFDLSEPLSPCSMRQIKACLQWLCGVYQTRVLGPCTEPSGHREPGMALVPSPPLTLVWD